MSDIVTGTQIDRYVLEEPLGTGGFSTVYRAHHSLIGNQVAFKLLKAEHTRNSVTAERFLREAQSAASIGNPHIVKVLDCGTAPTGEMFLVMELLEGESFSEVIGGGEPLPADRAVALTQQILDGLAAAHAAGIVHRDIKPDNIFLTTSPEGRSDFVKLLDFGVSKILDGGASALTTAGEVIGTPLYMAPEQITGSDKVDHRVDIYATAAVLYHALSGRPPHDADSLAQLAHMILTQEPPPLESVAPHLPPGLAAVIHTGLAREPNARWQTARSFSEALGPFTPTTPTAPGFLPTPATSPQGQPAASIGSSSFGSQPAIGSSPALGSAPGDPTGGGWSSTPSPAGSGAAWPAMADSQPSMPGFGASATATGPQPASPQRAGKRRLPLWAIFLAVGLVATVLGGATVTVVAVAMRLLNDEPETPPTVTPTPTPTPPTPYPTPTPPTEGQTPGAPRGNAIQLGRPLMGVLPMGQRVDYPLRIDQRGLVTITLQSDQFDTFVYLIQNGTEIGRDDDGGGGLNSRLSMWLEPGLYAVRVGSFADQGGGQFVLSVVRSI